MCGFSEKRTHTGGWVGQKCDDFERTYIMDYPITRQLEILDHYILQYVQSTITTL